MAFLIPHERKAICQYLQRVLCSREIPSLLLTLDYRHRTWRKGCVLRVMPDLLSTLVRCSFTYKGCVLGQADWTINGAGDIEGIADEVDAYLRWLIDSMRELNGVRVEKGSLVGELFEGWRVEYNLHRARLYRKNPLDPLDYELVCISDYDNPTNATLTMWHMLADIVTGRLKSDRCTEFLMSAPQSLLDRLVTMEVE